MGLIYFLVAIIATTIGAAAGIGGGVIIKPVLDAFGNFNLPTINLLSSATIFSMAIVSIIKQIIEKDKIDIKRTTIIAIGSIIGGIIGQKILRLLITLNLKSDYIMILQSVILILLLIFVYFDVKNKDNIKKYNIESPVTILLIGIFLGSLAAFLGIGGGPINVGILMMFFSMDTKTSARNSIIIILFSQGAKILSIACTSGFASYNLSTLPLMIIGGMLGGIIGYKLNKLVSEKNILKIFNFVLLLIIVLNVYNIIKAIL